MLGNSANMPMHVDRNSGYDDLTKYSVNKKERNESKSTAYTTNINYENRRR